MVHKNSDKNCVYTVYEGELSELAVKVRDYCMSRYGDRCEFKTVSIERSDPEGSSWKVHDFPGFSDRTVAAIENHMKARRDFIRVSFGGDEEVVTLIITPARNTSQLARYIARDERKSFDEDDLVIMATGASQNMDVAAEMVEALEK